MSSASAKAAAHPPHISTAPPALASMDFAQLLSAGITACQDLGSAQWTDFNEHDPGVTILEQLCYAITDFGYRANYRVADLLASLASNAAPDNSTLFTGDQILCSNPMSANDFRKLIIDQVRAQSLSNFKNVWLEPVPGPNSLYNIMIEVYAAGDDSELVEQVRALFLSRRNLGEDIGQIVVLTPCEIGFGATIELAPQAPAEQTMAEVLFQIQNALVPFIVYTPVSQQLQAGVAPDQIYSGPLLQGGTIADHLLRVRAASVCATDLSAAILAVSGVQALSQLALGGADATGCVTVPDGQVARLSPSIFVPQTSFGPITVSCQGALLNIDWSMVSTLIARRLAGLQTQSAYAGNNQDELDYLTVPAGQNKEVAHYYSIQHQFPQTYGIGAAGLAQAQPQSAADVRQYTARQSQMRQLKAYLLFFEQLLADCGAQLEHAGSLLGLDPDLGRSYFCQSLADASEGPPRINELLRGPAQAATPDDAACSVHVSAPAPDGQLLLRSPPYPGRAAATAAQAALIARAQQVAAYSTRALPGGQFQVLLGDGAGRPAAFGSQRYASAAQAQDAIAQLADLMARIGASAALQDQCVSIVCRGTRSARLADAGGQTVLQAEQLSAAAQAQWSALLLRYGSNAANYRVSAEGGSWRLRLYEQQLQLAEGAASFPSQAEAAAGVKAAVALVQSLCCDDAARQRHLRFLPAAADGADPRVRAYMKGLQELVARHDPHVERRNRFLDHLLARFGEHFDDGALLQTDPRHSVAPQAIGRDLVGAKCAFLQRYVDLVDDAGSGQAVTYGLGSARSRGFDRTGGATPAANVDQSVMHARVRMLLDMPSAPATPGFLAGMPGSQFAPPAPDSAFVFKADHPGLFQSVLDSAEQPQRYSIGAPDEAGACTLDYTDAQDGQSHTVHRFNSQAEAEAGLADLRAALRQLSADPAALKQGEQLVLVEHVLLRPAQAGAQAAPDDAFYANRISVMFSAQPLRAQNPAFRALAERITGENCPAHLDARCYWLVPDQMQQFNALHTAWLRAQTATPMLGSGQEEDAGAAQHLADFIQSLGNPA